MRKRLPFKKSNARVISTARLIYGDRRVTRDRAIKRRSWLTMSVLVIVSTIVLFRLNPHDSFQPSTPLHELARSSGAGVLALRPDVLDQLDIAVMNLAAADGLIEKGATTRDEGTEIIAAWAKLVAMRTAESEGVFRRDPRRFENSEGYFKMHLLADVLVNGIGLRYDPLRIPASEETEQARIETFFFSDPKVIFIHGLLQPPHFGTCASIPVIYVAVARRLGYPVSLAATEEHLYVRYDEPNGDHFNVEATAISHFKTPPDEYYRNECRNRTEQEIREAGWVSRDPVDERGGANLYALAENSPPNAVDCFKVPWRYKRVAGIGVAIAKDAGGIRDCTRFA
jgi:hypothetical protein